MLPSVGSYESILQCRRNILGRYSVAIWAISIDTVFNGLNLVSQGRLHDLYENHLTCV